MTTQPGYLYILQNDRGRYYVGSCVDPSRRLTEHQRGSVTATASKGPWQRVALLRLASPTAARKAEYWLKRLRDRRLTEMIIANTFQWPERFGKVIPVDHAY